MTNDLYAIGTPVALLPETMGDTVTGTIAGYTVYTHPIELGLPQQGYIVHLDKGAFLDRTDLAPGARPYIGSIVCHVESVAALVTT